MLSILAMESAVSIRSLYRHFLSGITRKSLNAFYYACSYAKADYSRFMNVTAGMTLKLIPEKLSSQPVFLCIDDTMAPKFGKKFEDVSKLFDHAAHNGSNYLNGHCFVSVMLCVPVWNKNRIHYLSVPLGYRMWQKQESKLELAASMVRQAMPEFSNKKNVIILCDSWYVKKNLVSIVDEYENLDLIGNARSDSVIYDLPPQRAGKRGRPALHGKKLSIQDDFTLSDEKIGDYYMAVRHVLTNIFGKRTVLAYVTSADKAAGSRRLFFSTVFLEQLQVFCAWQEKSPLNQTGSSRMQFIPLILYAFRWPIEVSYYEQKTFWSLCSYMVRSRKGIEMLVNLINISYCAMRLLPYQDKAFYKYQTESVQEFRFALSEQIRQQVFYAIFVEKVETSIKSNALINALKRLVQKQGHHL
ncbi:hypothetical protein D7X87_20360 [bacterium D16-54]|nr:hypothetical protein D7X87_20360 [bacterium D16-54]RKJ11752.1 hypothetical protein D7X65_20795 [bacterium D16-56]